MSTIKRHGVSLTNSRGSCGIAYWSIFTDESDTVLDLDEVQLRAAHTLIGQALDLDSPATPEPADDGGAALQRLEDIARAIGSRVKKSATIGRSGSPLVTIQLDSVEITRGGMLFSAYAAAPTVNAAAMLYLSKIEGERLVRNARQAGRHEFDGPAPR